MKWTEEMARGFFATTANWEPAQALVAALDAERVRNAKLEEEQTRLLGLLNPAITSGADWMAKAKRLEERNAKLEAVAEVAQKAYDLPHVGTYDGKDQEHYWEVLGQLEEALAALKDTP